LQIGSNHAFTRIINVLPFADDSVVIVDAGNQEIGVFTPAGAYSHPIGRTGRGPGEFLRLQSAGLFGDTLWVLDSRERRAIFFARDGKVLATIRNESGRFLTGMLGDGALGLESSGFGSGREFRDETVALVLTTRAGLMIDTIALVPSRNENFALARPDGGFSIGKQRFSDTGLTILAPGSRTIFLVDRSVTRTPDASFFSVVALGTGGDTLWERRYRYAPKPLEKAKIDSLLEATIPPLLRAGHTRDEIRRAIFAPRHYPPITSGVASSDGWLWLRREEGQISVDYWILDSGGRLVATMKVPGTSTLMAVTESRAWGIEHDRDGVPTVFRYRIER
jgi:hypothetical protein